MNKISLLIVDDEQYVLSSLRRLFHSEKYQVYAARTTQEALKVLEETPIGVIICDQKLKGSMEGTDFFAVVKLKWPDSSRILLTGYFNSQIAENSLLKGEVYRFISKPWNDEDLKMTVENSWKRYELLKQNRDLIHVIRSQNEHLGHLSLNLKNVIDNRIERLLQSQNAVKSKKIQLQIVHSLIKGLNQAKAFENIYAIVEMALKKLLKFDALSILIQLGPSHNVLLQAKKPMADFHIGKFPFLKQLFENPTPLVTDQGPLALWGIEHLKSHLIFPLFDDKDPPSCLGSLNIASKRRAQFTQEDIKKLSDILNPIAIAIEKMKLLEIVEQGSKQWESTFDAIGDLVTVIDKNFTLVKANRATEGITHQRVEKVIGKKCYEVLARRKSPCKNCPAQESFKNTDVTHEHEISDFKNKDYLSWSYPMMNAKNQVESMVIYYRDHTESSKLFRQLIQSEKMAAVGHLAGSLAHELNNPLTGITAFAQLLSKELDAKSPLHSDIIEIEKASLRCKEIIENLLHFSEKNKYRKQTLVSINDIIESTLPLIQYSAHASSKIDILKNYSKHLPKIKGNANELQQVFFNLLLNAIQAMPKGGKLEIKTHARPKASELQISISDTGVGISQKNISKIFDPFYTTKEKTHGTGLGLFVSYGIVKDHMGTIKVKSQLRHGSQFKVILPVEKEVSH